MIMTRSKEQFFDNKERILFYRDSLPDLLISFHLNSSDDPIRTGGTATFYRYTGFRNLSLDIYKRMLELGLKEYGNTGSFNFMLNLLDFTVRSIALFHTQVRLTSWFVALFAGDKSTGADDGPIILNFHPTVNELQPPIFFALTLHQ